MADRAPRENPADGPMQDRRERGVAVPERARPTNPASDTPDQEGIEIDHETERPHSK